MAPKLVQRLLRHKEVAADSSGGKHHTIISTQEHEDAHHERTSKLGKRQRTATAAKKIFSKGTLRRFAQVFQHDRKSTQENDADAVLSSTSGLREIEALSVMSGTHNDATLSAASSYQELLALDQSDFGTSLSSSLSTTKQFDFFLDNLKRTTIDIPSEHGIATGPRSRARSVSFFGHYNVDEERDALRKSSAFTFATDRESMADSICSHASADIRFDRDSFTSSLPSDDLTTIIHETGEQSMANRVAMSDSELDEQSRARVEDLYASPWSATPLRSLGRPAATEEKHDISEDGLGESANEHSDAIDEHHYAEGQHNDAVAERYQAGASDVSDEWESVQSSPSSDQDNRSQPKSQNQLLVSTVRQETNSAVGKRSRFQSFFGNGSYRPPKTDATEHGVLGTFRATPVSKLIANTNNASPRPPPMSVRGRAATPYDLINRQVGDGELLPRRLDIGDNDDLRPQPNHNAQGLGQINASSSYQEDTRLSNASSSSSQTVLTIEIGAEAVQSMLIRQNLAQSPKQAKYTYPVFTRARKPQPPSEETRKLGDTRPGTPYAYGKAERKVDFPGAADHFDPDESMTVNAPDSPQLLDIPAEGYGFNAYSHQARQAILNKPLPSIRRRDNLEQDDVLGKTSDFHESGYVGKGKHPMATQPASNQFSPPRRPLGLIGANALNSPTKALRALPGDTSAVPPTDVVEVLSLDTNSDKSSDDPVDGVHYPQGPEDIYEITNVDGHTYVHYGPWPTLRDASGRYLETLHARPSTPLDKILHIATEHGTTPALPSDAPIHDGWVTLGADEQEQRRRYVQLDRYFTEGHRNTRANHFAHIEQMPRFDPRKRSPSRTPSITDSDASEIEFETAPATKTDIAQLDHSVRYSPTRHVQEDKERQAYQQAVKRQNERAERLQLLFQFRVDYGMRCPEVWPDSPHQQRRALDARMNSDDELDDDLEQSALERKWHRTLALANLEQDFDIFRGGSEAVTRMIRKYGLVQEQPSQLKSPDPNNFFATPAFQHMQLKWKFGFRANPRTHALRPTGLRIQNLQVAHDGEVLELVRLQRPRWVPGEDNRSLELREQEGERFAAVPHEEMEDWNRLYSWDQENVAAHDTADPMPVFDAGELRSYRTPEEILEDERMAEVEALALAEAKENLAARTAQSQQTEGVIPKMLDANVRHNVRSSSVSEERTTTSSEDIPDDMETMDGPTAIESQEPPLGSITSYGTTTEIGSSSGTQLNISLYDPRSPREQAKSHIQTEDALPRPPIGSQAAFDQAENDKTSSSGTHTRSENGASEQEATTVDDLSNNDPHTSPHQSPSHDEQASVKVVERLLDQSASHHGSQLHWATLSRIEPLARLGSDEPLLAETGQVQPAAAGADFLQFYQRFKDRQAAQEAEKGESSGNSSNTAFHDAHGLAAEGWSGGPDGQHLIPGFNGEPTTHAPIVGHKTNSHNTDHTSPLSPEAGHVGLLEADTSSTAPNTVSRGKAREPDLRKLAHWQSDEARLAALQPVSTAVTTGPDERKRADIMSQSTSLPQIDWQLAGGGGNIPGVPGYGGAPIDGSDDEIDELYRQ